MDALAEFVNNEAGDDLADPLDHISSLFVFVVVVAWSLICISGKGKSLAVKVFKGVPELSLLENSLHMQQETSLRYPL